MFRLVTGVFLPPRASFNLSCPAGVRVSYCFYLACWKMLLFYIQGIIMDIESQVGYFSFSVLKMSFHWLLAFVVSDGHSQSLIFSSLILMCFLVWFYHCVCVLFYLVCLFLELWVYSFHQIWENFHHFKKESLPGSFSVFFQDSNYKCVRLSGIVADVSEAARFFVFFSLCVSFWIVCVAHVFKFHLILSFSLFWSAVNYLPWRFLVIYVSFLKVLVNPF